MFSSLLEGMRGTPKASPRAEVTRASSAESGLTAVTTDDASNAQSSTSTPPTSIGDSVSVSSASLKLDIIESTPTAEASSRSRRQRTSVGTYNVKVLSGTAIHAPRKYCKNLPETGNEVGNRSILADNSLDALELTKSASTPTKKSADRSGSSGPDTPNSHRPVTKSPKPKKQFSRSIPKKSAKQVALERRESMKSARKAKVAKAMAVEPPIESIAKRLSVLGKRGRAVLDDPLEVLVKAKRELRNLADTAEFAKIDTKPVIHEVWSNGKLVVAEPPRKKRKQEVVATAEKKSEEEVVEPVEKKKTNVKKQKTWLNKGLYAGQQDKDWFAAHTDTFKQQNDDLPQYKPSGFLPLPMWHGQRLLHVGRDFKLPFDVCSPLPPGQPKPEEWHKTSSNRFVGEASALWKKSSLFDSFSSKCVCTSVRGCDDNCQNRIMLYECDDTNCGAGRAHCTNRAFAQLQERRRGGGKYRIGVEVIKTEDRGYGVRSNRCFDANQVIVEYTGEIITEDECDRRMNEDYKNNECYYLMSFDQNMIIDATKGSIARFVNHSCRPNCKMEKWIVGGKPRMALFAGDNPIMSGDELTYDYNFDPFSAKNVQECRCGSDNCRGVLGPRPKDQKPVKEAIKDVVKAGVKAGKRKLKELLGANGADFDRSPKKRKIKAATGVKRVKSSASIKVAKGAARIVKKTVSTSIVKARQPAAAKRNNKVVAVKTRKVSVIKAYSKRSRNPSRKLTLSLESESNTPSPTKPRRSGSTPKTAPKTAIKKARVAKKSASPKKSSSPKKAAPPKKAQSHKRESTPVVENDTIQVIDQAGDDSDATQDDTSHSLLYLK